MRDGGYGGSLIFLSSLDALNACPGRMGCYGAAKAAVTHTMQTVAVEPNRYRIRVNAALSNRVWRVRHKPTARKARCRVRAGPHHIPASQQIAAALRAESLEARNVEFAHRLNRIIHRNRHSAGQEFS